MTACIVDVFDSGMISLQTCEASKIWLGYLCPSMTTLKAIGLTFFEGGAIFY